MQNIVNYFFNNYNIVLDLNKPINKLDLIINLNNIRIKTKDINLANIEFKNMFNLISSGIKLNKIRDILYILNQ